MLADLALEAEATTALAMRMARAYDAAENDPAEAHLKRLGTAVGKYYVCKRAPQHAFEALECFGGVGYVEESGMPRLYREAPLASIWEGSGNVMALDVLRALSRTPEALEAYFAEIDLAAGADARFDAFADDVRAEFADTDSGRVPRAADRREDGAGAAGLAARAARAAGRSPTRSAPRAWPATPASTTARCLRASTSAAIVERHTPAA